MKIKEIIIIGFVLMGSLVAQEKTEKTTDKNNENDNLVTSYRDFADNNASFDTDFGVANLEQGKKQNEELKPLAIKLFNLKKQNIPLEKLFSNRKNSIQAKCGKDEERLKKLNEINLYAISSEEQASVEGNFDEKSRYMKEIELEEKKLAHNRKAVKELGSFLGNSPASKSKTISDFFLEYKIISAISGLAIISGISYGMYKWYQSSFKKSIKKQNNEDNTFEDFITSLEK